MKTKIITACILILSTSATFAQGLTVGGTGRQLKQTFMKAVAGSVFLNSSFSKSNVVTVSDKKMELNALRYNLLTQDVEYQDHDEIFAVQDSLVSFTLTDTTGKVLNFVKKELNGSKGFFQEVVTGKADLLKRYTTKQETVTDWYTKKETKILKQQAVYYISKDGKIDKSPTSAKGLLALFSDKQEVVKTYIKEQSPDLKTETGLADVVKTYNAAN